jgi:uncharacterized protein (DUF885 family)
MSPPHQLDLLRAFTGAWICEQDASVSGVGGASEWTIDVDLGGYWYTGREVQLGVPRGEMGRTRLTFWSYDPVMSQFVGGWLDNTGLWSTTTSRGWEDGTIAFYGHVTEKGQKVSALEKLTRPNDGGFTRTWELFEGNTLRLARRELCRTRPAAAPAPAGATTPASPEWNAFVDAFIEGYFQRNPHAAVSAGRHEFDGKLPDYSRKGLESEVRWLKEQKRKAAAFKDAALDPRQRFEREYLISRIDGAIFVQETIGAPYRNPTFYGFDPQVYVSRPYAPLAVRMRAYTQYAKAVPAAAAEVKRNLRAPLPKTYVKMGHIAFGGLASYYEKDVPGVFASVDDKALRAEFEAANAGAIKAMKELDAWFTTLEKTATDDFALGAKRFREMLWATERVDAPLAELKAIGERDLERNLKALAEECAVFAPGQTVEQCVEKVGAQKPEGSPVEAALDQLTGLRAFVVDRQLVTIPGPETAEVRESPPYMRWNAAYIDIPGPYEVNMPSVYYISPPDPSWSPEEQKAYIPGRADLLFISVHEVWPGHFLQFLHANRAASRFGQIFVGYAFAEGWAHYTEEMMWEAGLGRGEPDMHIGQLLNALLRNVRFLSAIGLHAEGMTVEQSERMFREKAYQDPGNARQQAARGTFDPAYLNYTMGKLMIRKLREDFAATRGGRAAWREFHDRFLSYGGPPIPLVREALMGAKGPLF